MKKIIYILCCISVSLFFKSCIEDGELDDVHTNPDALNYISVDNYQMTLNTNYEANIILSNSSASLVKLFVPSTNKEMNLSGISQKVSLAKDFLFSDADPTGQKSSVNVVYNFKDVNDTLKFDVECVAVTE